MRRSLTAWSLTLLTIGSVDSIRNLPAAALAGKALPGYFTLACLLFLLPCALICSWFSYQSSHGILGWVRQGLGSRLGLTAVWLQLMQNVLVYPTLFAFIAGALLFCINPALANRPVLIFFIINALVWALTFINQKGMYLSNRVNTVCATVGLIIPFAVILLIGGYTLWHHPHILSAMPNATEDGLTSLTAIMLSFCGLEIAAVHNEGSGRHAFSKAIVVAAIVIFTTMLLGSLTIALIIPAQHLNFVSDIPNLFQIFFSKAGYSNWATVMTILVITGSIGCANNWIIAPVKGLSIALDLPIKQLLLLQAMLISVLSTLFVFFATIQASYWFTLTLATQMYLLLYALMYIAAMKLSWHSRKPLVFLVAIVGMVGITIALIVSMQPPAAGIGVQHHKIYLIALIAMLSLLILPAWFLPRQNYRQTQWATPLPFEI